MNSEMEKDEKIERAFNGYFSGQEMPEIDLTAAKTALAEENARRLHARRRARRIAAAVSACACAVLACILVLALLPSMLVKRYEIASAQARTVSYTELMERGGLEVLSPFSLADNASAEYTLYSVQEKEVLLGAEVAVTSGMNALKATLYLDLSGGKYRFGEWEEFTHLPDRQGSYRYETEYVNGEFLSRAYLEREEGNAFVWVSSQSSGALFYFMNLLTR